MICRGRGWCGLTYCPIIASKLALIKLSGLESKQEIHGSSPPSVFVGRVGYPYVNIGPSTPYSIGDTSIYDTPEKWLELKLEDILSIRMSMVTGFRRVKIDDINQPFVNMLHELALSVKPVDIEVKLAKPIKPILELREHEPPQGPRSTLDNFRITSNPSIPRIVDKVYGDTSLRAKDAVYTLYLHGIPVSSIQKMLSVGALGKSRNRRIVPTRWSITTVDSIISDKLLEDIRKYPVITGYRLFIRKHCDNLFLALICEGKWSFEWMEAWYPGSTWNPGFKEAIIEGDYEGFHGRKSYPDIGGCYYACRLAVAEYFARIKRQGVAIVLREIYPGFNIPIGVWFVRENIRSMLSGEPVLATDRFYELIRFFENYSRVGFKKWVEKSRLLKRIIYNDSILRFLEKK